MEFSLKGAVLVTAVLTLAPLVLVKNDFFRSTILYQGRVTDAVDGYPVDLVEVSSGSEFTFSDRNGLFTLKIGAPAKTVKLGTTVDYQTPTVPLTCNLKTSSLLTKSYDCNGVVYPQPFNMAIRVLSELIGQDNQTLEVGRARKEKLWNYLSGHSQAIWRSKGYFADLMLTYEETSRRLKTLPVSFRIEKRFQSVGRYLYKGQEIKDNLVSVEATLFFRNGKTGKETLYFVKEGTFWKYLLPETPQKVVDFNKLNIWVFNK